MKRCKHEGCDCPVPTERFNRGDEYCSEFCSGNEAAQSPPGDTCGCGHPSCHQHGT